MPTSTTNYGWQNPANGDTQAGAEQAITATIDAIDADLWGVAQAGGGGGGTGGHTILLDGVAYPQRAALHFTGAVLVYDDAANDRTIIHILGGDAPADTLYLDGEAIYLDGEPLTLGD